jgi:hypothetical protein
MASLIDETPQAEAWLDSKREDLSMLAQYGRIVDAVLWTSSLTDEGTPLVDVEPNRLVDEVNSKGLPLLINHDPGAPRGMVLCAGQFTSPSGTKFVAGLIGMYAQGDCLSFESIGIGDLPPVQPPKLLSPLSEEGYISVAVDPREVDETWIGELLLEPPIPVKHKELSHNALEASAELIRVALPYVLLVWNPFVTQIAREAGKDAYAGVRAWLQLVITKLSTLKNPILVMESWHDGCHVMFVLRGNGVGQHYAAHEKLSDAAAQAAQLIAHLKARKLTLRQVVYEYIPSDERWAPSKAILSDGRLISRQTYLIALEQAPIGLSLGLTRNKLEERRDC